MYAQSICIEQRLKYSPYTCIIRVILFGVQGTHDKDNEKINTFRIECFLIPVASDIGVSHVLKVFK